MERVTINGHDYIIYEHDGKRQGYPITGIPHSSDHILGDIEYIVDATPNLHDAVIRAAAYLESVTRADQELDGKSATELIAPYFNTRVYDSVKHTVMQAALSKAVKPKGKEGQLDLFAGTDQDDTTDLYNSLYRCCLAALWYGYTYGNVITTLQRIRRRKDMSMNEIIENFLTIVESYKKKPKKKLKN